MSAYTVPFQEPALGPQSSRGGPSTYQWVLAWIALIGLLALATRTEIGHTLIYYALVLILIILLVTQYQFVAAALAPIGQPPPSVD